MAQDEKAQFAAIKTLMVNGEFDKALARLEAIGGPKAEEWIAEIKARNPLQNLPPMPADDLTQAQRLIEQRKYEEAEALLKASEHESAALLMKKLVAARHAEQDAQKVASTPAPVSDTTLRDRLANPLALTAIGAGVGLVVLFVITQLARG